MSTLSDFRWPIVVVVCVVIFCLLFRRQIADFIDRIVEARYPGGGLTLSGPKQESDEKPVELSDVVKEAAPAGAGETTTDETVPKKTIDKLVDGFVSGCKFEGLECLYALDKARVRKKPLISRDIVRHRGERFYGFFYGFVVSVRSMGLAKFTASHGEWTVTRMHPRITAGLEDAIWSRCGPKRKDQFKKLHEMLGIPWDENKWMSHQE